MASGSGNSLGLEIAGAMLTDTGCVRPSNEDAVAYVIPGGDHPNAARGSLLVVADGMGGHAAGEIASRLAVEVVRRSYYAGTEPVPESLMIAFEAANRAILEHARKFPECKGMGTTCTAVAIQDDHLWLAHVGDSRAYLLRKGALKQLSADQSLHAQMIREGLMSQEEAEMAGGRNVILQALGISPDIEPDVWEKGIPLKAGDVFILCSDGLWNMVDDVAIAAIAANREPEEACKDLIAAALEAGGYDNVSAGVFATRPAGGAAIQPQTATRRIAAVAAEDAPNATATPMIELPEEHS
jgi:serine/threonine protein phosphatase PrpC